MANVKITELNSATTPLAGTELLEIVQSSNSRKVSAADMGWLASTGGGGKVAVYHDGVKITPDVRGIDFTGSGVASVTKENGVGGKLIVNIQGGAGNGATGPTGQIGRAHV